MEEFASYTGRSLATFKRDFKKFTPLTPEKWLVEQRFGLSPAAYQQQHIV